MKIRPIRWPEEIEAVKRLDASFSSGRAFHVVSGEHSFILSEKNVSPPMQKSYSLAGLHEQILPSDHTFVAENSGSLLGIASMRFEAWNKRAMLRHLYIGAEHRRSGAGRALVEAVSAAARALGARCLWVETQSTNHPAVRFYLGLGFRLCGLDTSLYVISDDPAAEIGLFFAKPVRG
jgi:GNAT superfamily N-acetyltransferase